VLAKRRACARCHCDAVSHPRVVCQPWPQPQWRRGLQSCQPRRLRRARLVAQRRCAALSIRHAAYEWRHAAAAAATELQRVRSCELDAAVAGRHRGCGGHDCRPLAGAAAPLAHALKHADSRPQGQRHADSIN
jgi:hypothetical protein